MLFVFHRICIVLCVLIFPTIYVRTLVTYRHPNEEEFPIVLWLMEIILTELYFWQNKISMILISEFFIAVFLSALAASIFFLYVLYKYYKENNWIPLKVVIPIWVLTILLTFLF